MVAIRGITLPVLVIDIDTDDVEKIKKQLQERLNSNFFKSGKTLTFLLSPKENVSPQTVKEIENFLQELGFKPLYQRSEKETVVQKVEESIIQQAGKERVKIVTKSIRAGQRVEYNGDVIIIGDVNPGAEVIAAGNIIVMGALKGVAWAGYLGDKNAVIYASKMQPQQLRIANIFAIVEEEELLDQPDRPEMAKIQDDEIVIVPMGYYKSR
jgi:septum site-determining protein MinC